MLAGLPLLIALLAFGCANPADGKHEATVDEADPVPVANEAGTPYAIDTAQSALGFVGSKITGSHEGGFNEFEGTIEVVDGEATRSSVKVRIDTTSLWADDDRLAKHLKSADFFDVENMPEATFESTSIEGQVQGDYMVTGNLTLHGVTKSISFPAEIQIAPDRVTAQAEFFIKRFDFGIVYPGKPDDLIRDEVVIQFDLVALP
jgi:polyisoprenoid-binding protein YceI